VTRWTGRLAAVENPASIDANETPRIGDAGAVTHQPTGDRELRHRREKADISDERHMSAAS
jgi:hypothetical protein